MPRRIYFSGFSHPALDYLPLPWGLLRAYAETQPEIRASYTFERPFFRREPAAALMPRVHEPFMLAVSCYVWNFEHTLELCRAIKASYPACVIVAGGPHVPERPGDFFERYPCFDVLVHGEGEVPFAQLLSQYLEPAPDLAKVQGISFNDGGRAVTTGAAPKLPKEIDVPSPYLAGYFDDCLEEARMKDGRLNVLWETNRGCPYGCTYCDWGSATMNKLRLFSMERLDAEIDWFARKGVHLVNLADANFGLIARDLDITKRLVETRARTDFPVEFRTNFAKNSNERVFEISRLLHENKMFTGTTLSMQTTDAKVLDVIKRSSIGIDNYQVLKTKYAAAGIPTYTELILGLPEETRDSWMRGLCGLLRTGHHEDIRVWPLAILPNAPMKLNGDVEKYEMRTVTKRIFASTSETLDLVVATSTLPTEDWIDCFAYSTMIIAMHCGGYTRFLSMFLERERGIKYDEIYDLMFSADIPGLRDALGSTKHAYREFATNDAADVSFMNANPKTRELIARYGTTFRPGPISAAWLLVNEQADAFYTELERLLAERWPKLANDAELADVIAFQRAIMLRPDYDPTVGKQVVTRYDWPRYFQGDTEPRRGRFTITFRDLGMGLDDVDPLIKDQHAAFARAACGPAFPISTFRRFFHQFDRMTVSRSAPLRVLAQQL